MPALLPGAARREQPDLLVVTDRARRGARQLGELADPQRPLGDGAHAATSISAPGRASSSRSEPFTCRGRAAATNAPITETPARYHSAVCMLAMNGTSWELEMWLARPENTANRTVFGTDEVTMAIRKAIDMTAPVFCT